MQIHIVHNNKKQAHIQRTSYCFYSVILFAHFSGFYIETTHSSITFHLSQNKRKMAHHLFSFFVVCKWNIASLLYENNEVCCKLALPSVNWTKEKIEVIIFLKLRPVIFFLILHKNFYFTLSCPYKIFQQNHWSRKWLEVEPNNMMVLETEHFSVRIRKNWNMTRSLLLGKYYCQHVILLLKELFFFN